MPAHARPLNILLVEDDDDHAELTSHALATHAIDHRAVRAHDGAEALDILFRRGEHADALRPDMVLLDLNLPRVSGLEVLEAVKRDEVLRAIPIIVLTTSDDRGDRARAYRNHVNSYLVKPFDHDSFQALVHEVGEYWGRWNRPA